MSQEIWIEEYKEWNSDLKPFQIKLLEEGASSQSQQWLVNQMWCDWKDMKKIKDTELPSLQRKEKDPWEEKNTNDSEISPKINNPSRS